MNAIIEIRNRLLQKQVLIPGTIQFRLLFNDLFSNWSKAITMKQSLKIILTFCLIANLFLSLYPKRIILELDLAPINPVKDYSFAAFEQSKECFASVNHSQKDVDTRPQKLLTLGKLHTKSCLNHFEYLTKKKYILQNELIFNLPYICYKFPLSEHTEEG